MAGVGGANNAQSGQRRDVGAVAVVGRGWGQDRRVVVLWVLRVFRLSFSSISERKKTTRSHTHKPRHSLVSTVTPPPPPALMCYLHNPVDNTAPLDDWPRESRLHARGDTC